MGRDFANLQVGTKRPMVINGVVINSGGVGLERVHVSPRISTEKAPETKDHKETEDQTHHNEEELQEKQDDLLQGDESSNMEDETEKSTSPPPPPINIMPVDASSNTAKLDSPTMKKQYDDEEDNDSMGSPYTPSSMHSVRSSTKFKLTVPVGPTFRSAERLQRRKEYYKKLEEKHKALEAEKQAYLARIKEEEEAAIEQLRKSMTYKANPVPDFYREGPPPKPEPKKLPVTRAKSPNLTRGKSCHASPNEKKPCSLATRHRNKDLSTTRNANGLTKLK